MGEEKYLRISSEAVPFGKSDSRKATKLGNKVTVDIDVLAEEVIRLIRRKSGNETWPAWPDAVKEQRSSQPQKSGEHPEVCENKSDTQPDPPEPEAGPVVETKKPETESHHEKVGQEKVEPQSEAGELKEYGHLSNTTKIVIRGKDGQEYVRNVPSIRMAPENLGEPDNPAAPAPDYQPLGMGRPQAASLGRVPKLAPSALNAKASWPAEPSPSRSGMYPTMTIPFPSRVPHTAPTEVNYRSGDAIVSRYKYPNGPSSHGG